MERFSIDADIRKAYTPPNSFYTDPAYFEATKEAIFMRSWQISATRSAVQLPKQVFPFPFMESFIDEPLVLTRSGDGNLHCLSNVCTHRGNVICQQAGKENNLRCGYHGRRFGLDGQFEFMPEFKEVEGFPSEKDNLKQLACAEWGGFIFSGINPAFSLDALLAPMKERVGWMPIEEFVFDESRSRNYLVKCHWALYVDNFLEGFHIPFIHPDLAKSLDYNNYHYELYDYANLQVGEGSDGEVTFDLPSSSPDYGKEIAAYYYWLFPNIMFNFYPWGLSLNIIRPVSEKLTRVSFQSYVWKPELLDMGAGAMLDKVEREDEEIVERVQRGVQSAIYNRGRYSPNREAGVHHFHRLVEQFLNS